LISKRTDARDLFVISRLLTSINNGNLQCAQEIVTKIINWDKKKQCCYYMAEEFYFEKKIVNVHQH